MERRKRKIKIISIVSVILIIAVMTLSVIQFFISSKNTNDIETIKISKSGYLLSTCTCEINFSNNSFMYETVGYSESDESKTVYEKFTDKEAKSFMKKANFYGFFRWKESYDNSNVYDGKGVTIHIKFTDGSVQETNCYAKFPFTYDKMAEAFYETFGYNIL